MKENLNEETKIIHIAIVGRPNVGKSTLFNRLIGRRKSITDNISGTTRDRIYSRCDFAGKEALLVDTGGMKYAEEGDFDQLVDSEVNKAVVEADHLIYMVDISGLTDVDFQLVDDLRRRNKKVTLVVNKVDEESTSFAVNDFYALGLGEPVPISAMHGTNVPELVYHMHKLLPDECTVPTFIPDFNLTIVGEPNAGKSTLLNQLMHKERSVVSDMPGTTRDTVEEDFHYNGHNIRLVDTAGIKKKKKMKTSADVFSLFRADKSIRHADVVILLIDADKGPQKDSRLIYQKVREYKKACIVAINKWDNIKGVPMEEYRKHLVFECGFLRNTPICFISAKTGRKVDHMLNDVCSLWSAYNTSIPTRDLNRFLEWAKRKRTPSPFIRLKYMVQVDIKPPTFVLFVKNKKAMNKNYVAFLKNGLISSFDFGGIEPVLVLKEEEKKK